MPERTATAADDSFASFFRESLSVITGAFLNGAKEKNQRVLFYEPLPKLVRKGGAAPLYLSIQQTYRIVPTDAGKVFKARTTSYNYGIHVSANGGRELLRLDWHPETTTRLTWPHLHVFPEPYDECISLAHFPTGRVCIEDFIRLLIRDLKVKPRLPHPVWKEILGRNRAAFLKSATWLYI